LDNYVSVIMSQRNWYL